jgi:hypothetical protein
VVVPSNHTSNLRTSSDSHAQDEATVIKHVVICYKNRFILLKNWQHESSTISISVSSEGTFGGIREAFLAKAPTVVVARADQCVRGARCV